jgi:hypothetical protein
MAKNLERKVAPPTLLACGAAVLVVVLGDAGTGDGVLLLVVGVGGVGGVVVVVGIVVAA